MLTGQFDLYNSWWRLSSQVVKLTIRRNLHNRFCAARGVGWGLNPALPKVCKVVFWVDLILGGSFFQVFTGFLRKNTLVAACLPPDLVHTRQAHFQLSHIPSPGHTHQSVHGGIAEPPEMASSSGSLPFPGTP